MTSKIARLRRLARVLRRRAAALWRMISLGATNVLARSRIDGGSGPTVSLTSFGPRIAWSFLTVETIALGDCRPRGIILWLSQADFERRIPSSLRRLERRGLQIRACDDHGPHKKYYPYVATHTNFVAPLVTADDDMDYPKDWLSTLVEAHESHEGDVVCHRGRIVTTQNGELAPYESWPLAGQNQELGLLLATGAGGVLYPPAMLFALKERDRDFVDVCPRADDIWLHQTALRAGIRVRLVESRRTQFNTFAITQKWALKHHNVGNRENDSQARLTYSPSDLATLNSAHARREAR